MKTGRYVASQVIVGLVLVAASVRMANAQEQQKEPPARPQTPDIMNVADIKSTPTAPTIVHLTEKQFARAKAGLKLAKDVPADAARVVLKPVPGGGALVLPICRQRRGYEVCDYGLVVEGGAPGERLRLRVTCNCGPMEPVRPESTGAMSEFSGCGGAFILPNGVMGCVLDVACTTGDCMPSYRLARGGAVTLYCACVER